MTGTVHVTNTYHPQTGPRCPAWRRGWRQGGSLTGTVHVTNAYHPQTGVSVPGSVSADRGSA